MTEIQDCLKASMKRKLKKSLSHDWIPESRAHAFPLRGYYVQLNWRRKIRSAMDTENVTVTSLHELIKEKIKTSKEKQENKIGHSFIIEGKDQCPFLFSLVDDFKNPPKTTQLCKGVQTSPYSGFIWGKAYIKDTDWSPSWILPEKMIKMTGFDGILLSIVCSVFRGRRITIGSDYIKIFTFSGKIVSGDQSNSSMHTIPHFHPKN